ncbi:MAG: response regulator [Pseudanabaena frigida]|uniref:Response regulator n=1 Tax=Pseudanabaena frigida TaxID=945775 RepID=A0A2W4VZJ9_9CYAN|nr:MAG: response regulator [Pseudanabaena frigida]
MIIHSQKNILFICADEYFCDVVQFCIEVFSKWRVIIARSREEALASSAKVKPDVILLDMLTPRVDNFLVLQQLRADPQLADIPVVILTIFSELTQPKNIAQLGVQGAITHPFHSSKITSQISRILGW